MGQEGRPVARYSLGVSSDFSHPQKSWQDATEKHKYGVQYDQVCASPYSPNSPADGSLSMESFAPPTPALHGTQPSPITWDSRSPPKHQQTAVAQDLTDDDSPLAKPIPLVPSMMFNLLFDGVSDTSEDDDASSMKTLGVMKPQTQQRPGVTLPTVEHYDRIRRPLLPADAASVVTSNYSDIDESAHSDDDLLYEESEHFVLDFAGEEGSLAAARSGSFGGAMNRRSSGGRHGGKSTISPARSSRTRIDANRPWGLKSPQGRDASKTRSISPAGGIGRSSSPAVNQNSSSGIGRSISPSSTHATHAAPITTAPSVPAASRTEVTGPHMPSARLGSAAAASSSGDSRPRQSNAFDAVLAMLNNNDGNPLMQTPVASTTAAPPSAHDPTLARIAQPEPNVFKAKMLAAQQQQAAGGAVMPAVSSSHSPLSHQAAVSAATSAVTKTAGPPPEPEKPKEMPFTVKVSSYVFSKELGYFKPADSSNAVLLIGSNGKVVKVRTQDLAAMYAAAKRGDITQVYQILQDSAQKDGTNGNSKITPEDGPFELYILHKVQFKCAAKSSSGKVKEVYLPKKTDKATMQLAQLGVDLDVAQQASNASSKWNNGKEYRAGGGSCLKAGLRKCFRPSALHSVEFPDGTMCEVVGAPPSETGGHSVSARQ